MFAQSSDDLGYCGLAVENYLLFRGSKDKILKDSVIFRGTKEKQRNVKNYVDS